MVRQARICARRRPHRCDDLRQAGQHVRRRRRADRLISAMTTRLTIRKPDDWHLHVRDGAMLKAVMPFTAKHFGRAILMPNLIPPVTTTKDAVPYRAAEMFCRERH